MKIIGKIFGFKSDQEILKMVYQDLFKVFLMKNWSKALTGSLSLNAQSNCDHYSCEKRKLAFLTPDTLIAFCFGKIEVFKKF